MELTKELRECFDRVIADEKLRRERQELHRKTDLDRMVEYFEPIHLGEFTPRCAWHRPSTGRVVSLGKRFRGIFLTEREAHVCLLLLKGCTSREAAVQMYLSPRTVEYYVSNIKAKLGVRRKSELISALLSSDFIRNMYFFTNSLPTKSDSLMTDSL